MVKITLVSISDVVLEGEDSLLLPEAKMRAAHVWLLKPAIDPVKAISETRSEEHLVSILQSIMLPSQVRNNVSYCVKLLKDH